MSKILISSIDAISIINQSVPFSTLIVIVSKIVIISHKLFIVFVLK